MKKKKSLIDFAADASDEDNSSDIYLTDGVIGWGQFPRQRLHRRTS